MRAAVGASSGTMEKDFCTSLDHVLAELNLTAFRIQSWAGGLRHGDNDDESNRFRGLYISDEEVDDILENPQRLQFALPPYQRGRSSTQHEERLGQLREGIAFRKKEAAARGLPLRLDSLTKRFGLSQFETDTLMVCLLPEIDLRYQKLYAYLQDDVTKKSPTVDFVLHLLCDSTESTLEGRKSFSSESPLLRYRLADLDSDRPVAPAMLLAKSIRIDDRIAAFLLDEDGIDSRLTRLVEVVKPERTSEDSGLPPDVMSRLTKLTSRYARSPLVCSLWGQPGTGKRHVAEAICSALGLPMLAADLKSMSGDEKSADVLVPLLFREGILYDAAIYLEGIDALPADSSETKKPQERVGFELHSYPGWVILASDKNWQPGRTLETVPFVSIELPPPSYAERRNAWEQNAKGEPNLGPDIDLGDLAGKFRFGTDQIRQAVAVAGNTARWRDPETAKITGEDLYAASRMLSRKTLISLARQIQPSYRWEDIVLPKDQMEQLREICSYVQHYHKVYSEWGFGKKVSSGRGLNALFYGASGTGKTMAADVIANALKIDLYKIDLSAIVSKYIGETEKNLDQIFREGQTSNAILFFDEADALFGKRSEVRDSHDRYANIEVAYLLQKMDEYDGVVILATNLRKNMDEAFARRMHFAVEFPLPEEGDRRRIWKHMFPEEAPLGKDVDLSFMARQFKLTGGNIKNIAINAAFLAAQDGPMLTMEHLVHATKREFQKIGKLCTQTDFAGYFDLVKG